MVSKDFNVFADRHFIDTVTIDGNDIINVVIDVEHNCLEDNFIIPFLEDLEKLAIKHRVCYDLRIEKNDDSIIVVNCCRG